MASSFQAARDSSTLAYQRTADVARKNKIAAIYRTRTDHAGKFGGGKTEMRIRCRKYLVPFLLGHDAENTREGRRRAMILPVCFDGPHVRNDGRAATLNRLYWSRGTRGYDASADVRRKAYRSQ